MSVTHKFIKSLDVFMFVLYLATPATAAPQGGNSFQVVESEILEDEVQNLTVPPIEDEKIDTLLQASRLPSSPVNVTDSAKICSVCGEGPQLACPIDGNCGSGEECCYDKCRERQVCRLKSVNRGNATREPAQSIQKRDIPEHNTTPISISSKRGTLSFFHTGNLFNVYENDDGEVDEDDDEGSEGSDRLSADSWKDDESKLWNFLASTQDVFT